MQFSKSLLPPSGEGQARTGTRTRTRPGVRRASWPQPCLVLPPKLCLCSSPWNTRARQSENWAAKCINKNQQALRTLYFYMKIIYLPNAEFMDIVCHTFRSTLRVSRSQQNHHSLCFLVHNYKMLIIFHSHWSAVKTEVILHQ